MKKIPFDLNVKRNLNASQRWRSDVVDEFVRFKRRKTTFLQKRFVYCTESVIFADARFYIHCKI